MQWPRRGSGRLGSAVAVAVAALAVTTQLPARPAAAAAVPISQCTTTSGVVLVVDFGAWGGPLLRSCGTTPTTGYTLLNQGGWHTTGTQHDGPGFVCRIGYAGFRSGTQYPTPAQDACQLTPPASAYWSYWHADPGVNTWSYSRVGAVSTHPQPGSVDLWTFGATDVSGGHGGPAFSPDSVRAHDATTTPPTRPSTPAPRPPATRPASVGSTAPSAGRSAATAPGPAASAAPTGSTVAAAGPGSEPPTPSVVEAAPRSAAPPPDSAGSPLPALIGLVVVAGLVAAAWWGTRRRRAGAR
jgi:hypothetical protein